MNDDIPIPDKVEGAPHPRETPVLYGQGAAERAFLTAYASDRLHHGWLLTGPRGVGKATLAWRIARFLLATPPASDDGLFGA
ncbi:DNA polymerase III subunit delta', partial [Cribrihabitans sp. XS_ASV171]